MLRAERENRIRLAVSHHQFGVAALACGKLDDALVHIDRAIFEMPENPIYHSNRGEVLRRMERFQESIAAFRKAIELNSTLAEPHAFLAAALNAIAEFNHAEEEARLSISLNPSLIAAYHNRGVALTELGRYSEALECLETATRLAPLIADCHYALSLAQEGLGRWNEALTSAGRGVELQPGDRSARVHLGLMNLRLEKFQAGWIEYEWRATPGYTSPRWGGDLMSGRILLVQSEQGFGDTVQFLRYLSPVAERSKARVIFECQPELVRLIEATPIDGVDVVARGSEVMRADCQIPLLSLPLALRTYEPLPMSDPYLRASDENRNSLRLKVTSKGLRVGLVWAGNAGHARDRQRSISPELLAPVIAVAGVTFYSLQIGQAAPSGAIDLAAGIGDFADTAAIMAELDLIITVDTAAAHLAGAMGRPVWTLLPFVPDWRWGLHGESTPWYPTMRLFRQTVAGDWPGVIDRVTQELQKLAR